jgi:intein/homing endonuclease
MKFDKNNFQLNKCDIKKGLELPKKMSKELAELVGIHFGDGCMNISNFTYRVYYSFNMRDKEYLLYVKDLFYRLFDVKMSREEIFHKNTTSLYLHSKTLCSFFGTVLGISYGPKKELLIPDYIKSNDEYLRCFLKGLFDTDGCITIQRMGKYSYTLVKISTKHCNFAKDIKNSLILLGIPSFITKKIGERNDKILVGYEVVVRNKSVVKFFEIIGSNNPRNLRKYKEMGTLGHSQNKPELIPF